MSAAAGTALRLEATDTAAQRHAEAGAHGTVEVIGWWTPSAGGPWCGSRMRRAPPCGSAGSRPCRW
ncbi:hypothetical protein [Streptomyces sp. NPDC055185]